MQSLFEIIIVFIMWTGLLYATHRVAHIIPIVKNIHLDHHNYINTYKVSWNWKNIFIWVDSWKSTADQWITEVIPTILISYISGHWWLIIFYWFWSAFVQEVIEHNNNFNIKILTSGKWHLLHHENDKVNFGVFTSVWDRLFGTYKKL